MGYQFYGYYSQIGTLPPENIDPAVYGLGETLNPIHEHTGVGFRPDFMPLENPDNLPVSPGYALDWDYTCPPANTPREQSQSMIGTQDRVRDTQKTSGRPIDRGSWEAHADSGYPVNIGYPSGLYDLEGSPEVVADGAQTQVYYGENFGVERRDQEVTPGERSYAGGGNFVPGDNSLDMNQVPTDRWDRTKTSDDFGPALRQGTDVIVTVDRDMIQAVEGNLANGLTVYPHPMTDNIAAVPQAPSQYPDRSIGDFQPYLPGGGMYSDRGRDVIPDATTAGVEQIWADDVPGGTADYGGSWE